jgi:plasmid stabilization system protein ParE
MTQPLDLSPAAKLDVAEAACWYADQRLGLDDEFLAAVEELLQRISENPDVFSFVHRELRRAVMRRFPYTIIYETVKDRVTVIAVMHASRDPAQWRQRTGHAP